MFPYNYPALRYKEIGDVYIQKIRILSSGTLSQAPDLENFATASRSRCQQNSSSSSSTVELVDTYTTDSGRIVSVYYKSVDCNRGRVSC